MLKQVQHDKVTIKHNACQPELVSGSQEMLKQVQHDKKERIICQPERNACQPELVSGSK